MHVLVTGGAGFIGSHSVERLLESGARVRVLDNFSSGKRDNLAAHPQLEVMEGDIRDKQSVDVALSGVSHVLHLAAQVSVVTSVQDPLTSAAINIGGFLNVLDGARRLGVQRVAYASSAAVYGVPVKRPLDEDAPTAPISPYGIEKSINDQYAELYHGLYAYPSLGLRYFNVFGPRQDPNSQYSGVISIFARRLREGMPLVVYGDGMQTRDFVYVGDVARANLAALKTLESGVCNVAAGRSVTLLELIEALGTVAGVKPQVQHAEARAGDIRYSSAENAKLCSVLGIGDFTSLHDGLQRLWATGV